MSINEALHDLERLMKHQDKQVHWRWAIPALAGQKVINLGDPGTGKTAMADSFCQSLNGAQATVDGLANKWDSPEEALQKADDGRWHFAEFQLSFQLPEDWKGIPFVLKAPDGAQYTSYVTDAMLHLIETRKYVVLVDELGSASPQSQAAALGWMCRPHGHSIILAAGNPPETAAAGIPLTAPMVSRCWLGRWDSEFTRLASMYYQLTGKYPAYTWPQLPANWREHVALIGADFVGWQRENGWSTELVQNVPQDIDKQSQPHPTILGWQNCVVSLAAALAVGANVNTRAAIAKGFVGEDAARDFLAFCDRQALPDVRDWIRNPYGNQTKRDMQSMSSDLLAKCCSQLVAAAQEQGDLMHVQGALNALDAMWDTGYAEVAQCWFPMVYGIPLPEGNRLELRGHQNEMLNNMIATG